MYENGSLLYWQEHCKNGIAIDIGAYTGIYSIVASVSGAAKVYGFEPNKFSREQFVKNVHANNASNINVNVNALGSLDGNDFLMMPKIRFHLRARRNGSGVQLGSSPIERDLTRWQKGQDVIVSTLDSQIPKHLHEKIKVIKIDVEGSELQVLMGATQILAKSESKLIIESLDNSTTRSIVHFLQEFSYKHVTSLSKNLIFEKD
jgi:FkbM family methyltransferase